MILALNNYISKVFIHQNFNIDEIFMLTRTRQNDTSCWVTGRKFENEFILSIHENQNKNIEHPKLNV